MLKILSRYNTERIFTKINNNLIKFEALEVLYYTQSGNDLNDPISIDPDGGPFLCKDYKIKIEKEEFIIEKFLSKNFNEEKEYLEVIIKVNNITNYN